MLGIITSPILPTPSTDKTPTSAGNNSMCIYIICLPLWCYNELIEKNIDEVDNFIIHHIQKFSLPIVSMVVF